jgi:hypothetical protein
MNDCQLLPQDKKVQERRSKVLALEAIMLQMKDRQVDLPLTHHFAPGLYLREMFIPAGVTLTGMIHKTEHFCILSQGSVQVDTDEGVVTYSASSVIKSAPGAKRAIHALEDSVWINVHFNPTNEQDLDTIEKIYTVKTFEELQLTQTVRKEIE